MGAAGLPWLKLLHLAAVTVWCGALLYLPLAIAAAGRGGEEATARGPVLRALFIGVATPAALVAIASGTLIFLLHGPLAPWLVAKLGVVALVVLVHGACGMLVLRAERAGSDAAPSRCLRCHALFGIAAAGLAVVAWLALAKPAS
jgi:protoporphyrinogen IX oxidase